MGAKLKDGRMLCAAANRLQARNTKTLFGLFQNPDSLQANACPKVNASSMPFKQMENVTQGVVPHFAKL